MIRELRTGAGCVRVRTPMRRYSGTNPCAGGCTCMSGMRRSSRLSGAALICAMSSGVLLPFEPVDAQPPMPSFSTTAADLQRESPELGDGPWIFETAQERIHVSVVTNELDRPFGMDFLPNGDLLVTELAGRLRLVRGGRLLSAPVTGVPDVHAVVASGLKDVAVHPDFDANGWVYLVYIKPTAGSASTTAVARGRLEGGALVGVRDIFVADASVDRDADSGARLAFDHDGFLYVTIGDRFQVDRVQAGDNHFGKVLRLDDDGGVPADNPFIGVDGYLPEIFTVGHRNAQGLTVNPWTGALWSVEHGPQGGDELNQLVAGGNYGWPRVTFGLDYGGGRMTETPVGEGLLPPVLFWMPAIAPSGMTFYSGDRFSSWRGDLFIGAMGRVGRGHVRRVVFDAEGREVGQEILLDQLGQRIRDVRAGPDGLIYVLTDEERGALLRVAPAPAGSMPVDDAPRSDLTCIPTEEQRTELVQLNGELTQARQRYSEEHPDVARLARALRELQRGILETCVEDLQ